MGPTHSENLHTPGLGFPEVSVVLTSSLSTVKPQDKDDLD